MTRAAGAALLGAALVAARLAGAVPTRTGSDPTAVVLPGARTPTCATCGLAPPPAQSQYVAAVLADAPVLYYRFGEASGTVVVNAVGENGTYSGGPALGQPGAIADGTTAVRLDGVDDWASIPSSVTVPAGSSLTIEWWQYLTAGDVKDALAFQIGPGDPRCQSHAPYLDSTLYWDYETGGAGGRVTTSYTPRLNTWTLIHLTYDAATTTHAISFDGVEVATLVSAVTPPTALSAGNVGGPPASRHKGVMDEFAIYLQALPPARRLAHFQAAALTTRRR